ncbi:MAG: Gfo/Idh/MocA family oxidoreductase [Oscillospiraceae bacterium]
MSNLKAGIIGCGGIANGKHMPAIKKTNQVDMVAFCDLIEEKAIKAKNEYGTADAKVYKDYKELLKDDGIDVIYVLTPNRSHSYITIDSLKAGKHVMCEKPMAKTYLEAQQMAQVAKETGKVLTIAYQNRCSAEALYLKAAIEDGELGDIYYAKAHAIRRRAVPTWGVFLNEYEQGGGPLIDIGTHALDLTLWEMNNYKPKMVVGNVYKKLGDQKNSANAWGDWDPKEYTVEDSAFGFITMENGATIVLEASWALNTLDVKEAKTTLCGTKGGADMENGLRFNCVEHNRQITKIPCMNNGGVDFFSSSNTDMSDLEAINFINAVTNGEELRVKPEEAMVVTRILEAIYESAKTHKPVYFND